MENVNKTSLTNALSLLLCLPLSVTGSLRVSSPLRAEGRLRVLVRAASDLTHTLTPLCRWRRNAPKENFMIVCVSGHRCDCIGMAIRHLCVSKTKQQAAAAAVAQNEIKSKMFVQKEKWRKKGWTCAFYLLSFTPPTLMMLIRFYLDFARCYCRSWLLFVSTDDEIAMTNGQELIDSRFSRVFSRRMDPSIDDIIVEITYFQFCFHKYLKFQSNESKSH